VDGKSRPAREKDFLGRAVKNRLLKAIWRSQGGGLRNRALGKLKGKPHGRATSPHVEVGEHKQGEGKPEIIWKGAREFSGTLPRKEGEEQTWQDIESRKKSYIPLEKKRKRQRVAEGQTRGLSEEVKQRQRTVIYKRSRNLQNLQHNGHQQTGVKKTLPGKGVGAC